MPHFSLHSTILLFGFACAASWLNAGCSLSANEQAAAQVISSNANSVTDCLFLQEIDTRARATLGNARFELKLAASKVGATHVVETSAYALPYNNFEWELGYALSGKAFKCELGEGPARDESSSYKQLPYDMPHPGVNRDDPMLLGPMFPSYIGKPQQQ